jgi:hypothetical protein
MTAKQPDFTDLNALAIEACDMWQEHLSTFAKDPHARAELTRFLEPQRRLFADWAAMMQQGGKHESTHETHQASPEPAASQPAAAQPAPPQSPSQQQPHSSQPHASQATPPRGAAYGDDPLRTAQLALRVAELEKRLVQLERQLADASGRDVGTARRTQRSAS